MNALRRVLLALAAVAGAAVVAGPALPARLEDDREIRTRAECSRGHDAELRIRPDDDALLVELRVESPRLARWTVVLVHERRIAFRRTVRAGRSSGLRVRRALPDLFGRDRIVARATGPRGETCRLAATV